MSNSLSVLQTAKRSEVRADPFPYVVLENALPDELYNRLEATFPSPAQLNVDLSKNNARWNYGAKQVASDSRLDPIWRDFIAYHASPQFYLEIVELFFDQMHERYPKQFPSLTFATTQRVGVRGIDRFDTKDILMDAMISGNTPVREATSVRRTHIDQGRKLFSGLFYMRRSEDDSTGGDLTISRFKPQYADVKSKMSLFNGDYVDDAHIELVETVKYRKNTAVLFINTIDSLHGVTVRQPTPHGRYFVNLVGETVSRLYRGRKGHPHYVNLAWPMDKAIPPVSIIGERLWARIDQSKRTQSA